MQVKHFVNDPDLMLQLSLKSLSIIQPNLSVDLENKTVYNNLSNGSQQCVSIISGGGAGHEPSFTGLVGDGLLTAAVSGSIFASPNSRQVLKAIEQVITDGTKGTLVTVMRYTGDVLNFGVALEKARALFTEAKIEMLIVNDDVALTRSKAGKVGRRGIAGTVLIHKITGALAAKGYDLDQVLRVGQLAANNLVSIGVSLNRVHVPGSTVDEDSSLSNADIELGMGIHNEAGCGKRSGDDAKLDVVVKEMLKQLLDPKDAERNYLPSKPTEIALLINNLGALSVLELGAVVSEVSSQLEDIWSIRAVRVYAGTFMTSLDGPGFSISLLNLTETGIHESFLDLLDAPSNARGWTNVRVDSTSNPRRLATHHSATVQANGESVLAGNLNVVTSRLDKGLQRLIDCETEITEYDNIVGDGDCGITLKRGALGMSAIIK